MVEINHYENEEMEMKKIGLTGLTLILLVSFGSVVNAQDPQATADVTAEVIKALTISPATATATFGNVEEGTSPFLDPQGTAHTDPGTNMQVAVFTVDGEPSSLVNVNYTNGTLTDGSGNSITFTTQLSESADGTQGSSTDLASDGDITLDSDGYSLYVGGGLGDLTGQTTGSYSTANVGGSAVTITVSYN